MVRKLSQSPGTFIRYSGYPVAQSWPYSPKSPFSAFLRFWTRCKKMQKMSFSVWASAKRTTRTLLGFLPDFSPPPLRPKALISSSSWRPRCGGLRWKTLASCWPVSVTTDLVSTSPQAWDVHNRCQWLQLLLSHGQLHLTLCLFYLFPQRHSHCLQMKVENFDICFSLLKK